MAEFQIVDANAAIGSHPSHKLNMTVERLMRDMNAGKIASSLIQSTHGIYDRHERGNSIVLESARANNRLIPIATINPLMFFGINQDIENLHSAGFRIFKFYPSHQNWDLESAVFSHIVKQLSSMNIPIMIDTPETGQPTKALRAAENYESTIILCSISLDTLSESLALMEDYPNVMIETHKLHVPGALEMITEKVGADRIVFGSGAPLRSLASSLSYIVCSNLPDDARQQILSRNILRVMGGKWMIIDTRMNFCKYDVFGRPYGKEGVLSLMDKYHIDKAVLISDIAVSADFMLGNKELYEVISSSDRLYGYLAVNPNYPDEAIELMKSVMSSKKFLAAAFFQGVGSPYANVGDYRAILNAYRRYGKPVFIDTPNRTAIEAAEEIAKEFNTIKFIFGSMGGNDWQRAISNNKLLNVCLETSGSFDTDKIKAAFTSFGPHRIMFGSNAPFSDPASMLGLVKNSGLSDNAAAKILSANAVSILGVDNNNSSLADE